MDDHVRLRIHAQETRRLQSRFAEDWFLCAVLAIDQAIRRAAVAFLSGGYVRRADKGGKAWRR